MKLKLVRDHKEPEYTIGDLSIDGTFFCNVLEDTVRPDGVKVYGKTAIPAGIYKIEFKHSPTFNRIMPYLVNVPGFTSVMMHWGNKAEDTLGCLLVGKNTIKGKVTESVKTFTALWEKIKDQTDLTIEIV